jgi:nucleoside-diphosphate-sugar epimerase
MGQLCFQELIGQPTPQLRLARRAAYSWDVVESYISARKLRTATGWRPQHDLAEAVRELMEAEQQPA